MIGWLNKLHHWSWIWLDGSCWIIICRRKCSFHICELGLKGECWRVTGWYVKRMQLKHNLSLIVIWDPSIPSTLIMKQFYQSFVGKFCNNVFRQKSMTWIYLNTISCCWHKTMSTVKSDVQYVLHNNNIYWITLMKRWQNQFEVKKQYSWVMLK